MNREAASMMGDRLVTQESLFYQFRLDDHIPADHMLRAIDRFVDLDGLRRHLAPFYSTTGRPSIDPELMIRMLLVGYCFGIRSERRLCEEVHLNLAYRWFCRLGLDGTVPDHSTFSKNRHGRFRDSGAFRHVFETVVGRCITEGLVGGEGFAVDASLIAADANKQRSIPSGGHTDWRSLAASRRAVREYLDTLDQAAWGAASEAVPKFVSPADPAAQWTGAHKGHAFFAYADNYLIDLKAAVILDVEPTRAIRQAEVAAARTMIERTAEALRAQAREACRRQRLRFGPLAGLAGKDQGNRAPHPGLGQIQARRWDILSIRLPVRRSEEHLRLSGGQDADDARNDRKRRSSPLPGQQVRLHAMPAEEPVLSERAGPQNPAEHLRKVPGCRPLAGRHRAL
jgi:transposase